MSVRLSLSHYLLPLTLAMLPVVPHGVVFAQAEDFQTAVLVDAEIELQEFVRGLVEALPLAPPIGRVVLNGVRDRIVAVDGEDFDTAIVSAARDHLLETLLGVMEARPFVPAVGLLCGVPGGAVLGQAEEFADGRSC